MLSGGVAQNVVPGELNATFDVRITPKMDIKDFEKLLQSWIKESEGSIKY